MNRIDTLFQTKKNNLLSIYFTAGYPELESTVPVLEALQNSGVAMVEIGMPFSDPLADGPVIQESSSVALKNGMSIKKLFSQLENIRETVHIPLVLMGYLNPVTQYGVENFCRACRQAGIDGVILPDLPVEEYQLHYQKYFEAHDLRFIFLITPQTTEARIREIDAIGKGFIYMVSSASTTGAKSTIAEKQMAYFERVRAMQLQNPLMIGFGISNQDTFRQACQYANGAIIGSAFVRALSAEGEIGLKVSGFVNPVISNR
jgi:tryptophan synthase alpha chain